MIDKDQYFKVETGELLKSLEELADKLFTMDDQVFDRHHQRGDFAAWIRDVFKNIGLASKVKMTHSKEQAYYIIKQHLGQTNNPQPNLATAKPVFKTDNRMNENHYLEWFENKKKELSDLHKKGADTTIPDILMYGIRPKIKIFEVTREKHDAEIVERLLKEFEDEISIAQNINRQEA